jgi:anti-sigma regulatory factor (Ser/Thr protein kinase)
VAESNSFSFTRTPDSVPQARASLGRLEERLSANEMYDASLCLSELVTNAVQHPLEGAGGELEVTMSLTHAALRVEVRDSGAGFDPGNASEGDERGWGLFIVDQLASRWGVESGEGTLVWFEIDRAEEDRAELGTPPAAAAGQRSADARRNEIANAVARLRLRDASSP